MSDHLSRIFGQDISRRQFLKRVAIGAGGANSNTIGQSGAEGGNSVFGSASNPITSTGGGGGGAGGSRHAGGGGAGGVLHKTGATLAAGSYALVIGAGGQASFNTGNRGGNGSDTTGFGAIAKGGGGGGAE